MKNYHPTKFVRGVQIVLLVLIIIGLGLLATQKIWVPKLVNYILEREGSSVIQEEVRAGKVDTGVEGIVTKAGKPFETTLILASTIIGRNGGVLIHTGKDGYFSSELPLGSYTLRPQDESLSKNFTPIKFEVQKAHELISLNLKLN